MTALLYLDLDKSILKKYFKMSAQDLINWGELSRRLSGSRQTVRKNKIPKIHQPFIDKLIKAMDEVIKTRDNHPCG